MLFLRLASNNEEPHLHAFFEWINPITTIDGGLGEGGAYPFGTGVSAATLALSEIPAKIGGETKEAKKEKETMLSGES